MTDVLLLETSLEGCLTKYQAQRRQADLFAAFLRSIAEESALYCERVHSVSGLREMLELCRGQNALEHAGKSVHGTRKDATAIAVVHINGHGDKEGLWLPNNDGGETPASDKELADAFTPLSGSGVRAIVFSACGVGSGGLFIREVMKRSGVGAVVGYPETAFDHVSAIAEQLLYYHLLASTGSKTPRGVARAVKRVNDCLALLGEPPSRMLSCYIRESSGEVSGPFPWWEDAEAGLRDKNERSPLLTMCKALRNSAGQIGKEDLQLARAIARRMLDPKLTKSS